MPARNKNRSVAYYLIANLLVIGAAVYAGVLDGAYPDFYYFSIQEDEYIEWASFWAFALAGIVAFVVARNYARDTGRLPWYFVGIGLFCLLVAMEEISWGQRVFGFRPPVYFLEHNYQQELNVHNVFATDLRKLTLLLIIAGYGIVLPVAGALRSLAKPMEKLGVIAPSPGLLPAFLATFVVYYEYPWSHSGEWAELMLGTGMLFSLLPGLKRREQGFGQGWRSLPATGLWAGAITLALGLLSSVGSRAQRDAHPETMAAARAEIAALEQDFESGRVVSRCSLHKRLYTFVQQYDQPNLLSGAFAQLERQGLPAERAEFLLDPWNSPYWIRDRCDRRSGRRVVFVYSFGPNRRRESTVFEIGGDDIGAYISPPGLAR